ncbi:MAG: DUF3656 domain-containing protein [Clostridia bacterium]|nr:DUF3656 domain-containing protein [Clostridia bacterium]
MKKMELLAPAGNMESLKAAVYNGANAVYLGVKEFNARNNIDGFSLDNLSQAVDFAHLYNVKVYLALNILFKDSELQSALDVVVKSNNIGVDAFIVQDLGLAYLIKKYYPSVELHASTQIAVHNLEGVRVLERLGFTRVVLARETSIVEIERISKNSNTEIEFFVQGALCVSFSGNCYMCSHLVNKSGNRGVCQQFCRLPYIFESENVKKSGFLLSAKDICMLDNLNTLSNLGVVSLKIEGRARRPFYVAQACKIYREMLDKNKYSSRDYNLLQLAFNREYTPAYFNGNGGIISQIQGNNGLEIGVVTKVNNGRKFNEIFIKSNYNLKGKCGLKFVYNNQEIASIGAHDIQKMGAIYRITTTSKIKVGSKVHIIQDDALEEDVLKVVKKLPIVVDLVANENEPIVLCAKFSGIEVCAKGEVCKKAKTITMSSEQVLKQLKRSEVFEVKNLNCKLNDCYVLNSTINKLRNDAYNKLQQAILEQHKKATLNRVELAKLEDVLSNENLHHEFNFKIIDNLKNLTIAENIIFDYNMFKVDDIKKLDKYCKQHNINGYIDLPNFATGKDIELIKQALSDTQLSVVANNLYALEFDCKIIGGQFLNIYNSFTLKILNDLHNMQAVFVEELSDADINALHSNVPILKREKVYMTLLHCPFKQNVGCDCVDCKYCDNATFTINSGKRFKIKRKKTVGCVFTLKD